VTLDGAGTFSAAVTLEVASFKPLESSPWEYGKQLGQAVFADPGLQRALAYARGKAARVSVALQIDAVPLQDLLWERLILSSAGEELAFAASASVALSRRIASETPVLTSHHGPLRLLLLLSSPRELDAAAEGAPLRRIDAAIEVGALREAWDPLVQRGLMQVSILARLPADLAADLRARGYRVFDTAATLDALSDRLTSFDTLHVLSHGTFKDGRASLLFENPEGRAAFVSEEDLLARLGERTLRLVFLQACQSAARKAGELNALSGLAPKLAGRAGGVIAMQDFVGVQDARRFAQEFYDTLLTTGLADSAVNAGRRALYRPGSSSWAIPALYLSPQAEQLWQPDAVLVAVQDLADQLRKRPDSAARFPIEVIRQWPGVSSKMETSPPGPRVRIQEAVSSALAPPDGPRSPIVVIAGNYGRAKTVQLYGLYCRSANELSRDDGRLPLFAHISDFQPTDDPPELLVANAVSRTYKRFDIDLPAAAIAPRLSQPFILYLDGDQDADSRQRSAAFDALWELAESNPQGSAVVTLDEQVLGHLPALNVSDPARQIPILLVQLLSPATVAQYLTALGARAQPLLTSIQGANLFDLAGVPWLLAHLMRQSNRGGLSRSGVIARVVNGNLASANLAPGMRRLVHDLLGRTAWALQTQQGVRLDGFRLYEVMDQVRGRLEVPLEQLKSAALATRILAPSDEDGVRFSYPGFQSFWCVRHLLDSENAFTSRLDDITATLGRRSRVRLWEDTLVLLAGMMTAPDRLIRRMLWGSSMSYGEHAFLAARCIHEAKLAGQKISPDVVDQVLDNLIWRSTPMKESSAAVRIRATEALALLQHPASTPHLISLAVERVRPTFNGQPEFELPGLRHASLQVLLTMQEQVDEYVKTRAAGPSGTAQEAGLQDLLLKWRTDDSAALKEMFETTQIEGLPALVVFALGSLGGESNLAFLSEQILREDARPDMRWSIADSLLLFTPLEVTDQAISRMRRVPALHAHAAYMIGKLRVATAGSEEAAFLVSCLQSPDVQTRGVALKALAQLGRGEYRELCECIARDAWNRVVRHKSFAVPRKPADRISLRVHALESLRLIGTEESLIALRQARNWRPEGTAGDRDASELLQLSYEVSEDIYWRLTGGLEGDFYEPTEHEGKLQ
jgi:hypothetical protein